VPREIQIRQLGLVAYGDALELQKQFVEQRRAGEIPDQLLLLEHPPVITLGVRTRNDRSHVVATPEALEEAGVEVFETGRGGDVTYHGPGQLVGYPILDLKPDRCDVHRYVRDLEEVLLRAVAGFGIVSHRVPGLTGTWVGNEKLGAIGVRIARWVTSHGFALNVSTNLAHFGLIIPCGITDKGVTSMDILSGGPLSMKEVEAAVTAAFCDVFDRQLLEPARVATPISKPLTSLSTLVTTDSEQVE
jgi:lipoyl(octanoyl) transferase